MTMPQDLKDKIELIRKKCIEANPDIVELNRGCEIMVGNDKDRPAVIAYYKQGEMLKAIEPATRIEYSFVAPFTVSDHLKIIGRPIRLSDVLLAIQNIGEVGDEAPDIGINIFGQWENIMGVGIDGGDNAAWNLRADDLTQQSEETITFIYSLLQ